jgi:hypothetical protein
MIPETKKVSLEEIDTLFGGSNHVEKGGDLLHVEDAHHANVGIDNVHGDVTANPDVITSTADVKTIGSLPQISEFKAVG